MTQQLNWPNLAKNKCPKCGKDFVTGLKKTSGMLIHSCGFAITEDKFAALSIKVYGQHKNYGKEYDN